MDDDRRFAEAAREGSTEAFTELVLRHQGRVRAYLGQYFRDPVVVDDLAQEVFLAAFQSLATFQKDLPLVPWLFGIARNRALEELRSESRRRAKEVRSLESAVATWRVEHAESNADAPGDTARQVAALQECIYSLPEHSQRMVTEVYFRSRTAAEVAREMGKNEGSGRVTLLRIRLALRRCIEHRLAVEGA